MKNLLSKLGLACSTSLVLTESLNLDVLWNALITLAVSILSVLTVEGVNWLKNWIVNHTKETENKDKSKGGE